MENSNKTEIAYKNFKIKVKKEALKSAPRWARDEYDREIHILMSEILELEMVKKLRKT